MAIKMSTMGEISKEAPIMASFEWKVPGFFRLFKEADLCVRSPKFSFLDMEWELQVYPNQSLVSNWIGLHLLKHHSVNQKHVAYHFGLRNADGTEGASLRSDHYFERFSVYTGNQMFVKKSSFRRKDIAPQGTVTFFCKLRVKSSDSKEVASQTTDPEVIDVSTKASKEDFKNSDDEVEDGGALHVPTDIDKLAQSLKDTFLSGEHHDTIIKVKDEEFRAHKFILVVRSSVFASMFSNDTIEPRTGVITIEDCDPKAFRDFLFYLYSGQLENLCTENVLNLYFIANKYEVEYVKAECVKFMINNFSIDNFCDFTSLAVRHDEKKLIKSAINYFTKNVKNIIVTVSWQCFYKKHPVESNELYIKAVTHLVPE